MFFKPYPTNHFTHPGIDGALAFRSEGHDSADIERIELGVAAPTLRTIAQPPDRKARPGTPHAARFSGPFTVAAALVGGGGLGVHLSDFTEQTISDPVRLALAKRVTCIADHQASEVFPHQIPGVLRVEIKGGSQWEHRVTYTRGGPERPLTAQELMTKFRLNAAQTRSDDEVDQLIEAVAGLNGSATVTGLLV